MSEEKNDPANTQMFRAFVERGDQESSRSRLRPALLLLAAALVVAVVAIVVVVA